MLVDLQDQAEREAFLKLWPIGKFPVLRDEARDRMVPELSIIVEYLDRHYPGPVQLIPDDPDRARQTRCATAISICYLHMPMQKIVGDRMRPADKNDPFGVEQARAQMRAVLAMMEADLGPDWMMGKAFSLADCATAPALFYAAKLMPLSGKVSAYLERLKARPSFARVLKEAEPYFAMFPAEDRR